MLTQSELKSLLNYDIKTGQFTWAVQQSRRVKIGSIAGTIKNTGYLGIHLKNKIYQAHRLAWLYFYGEFPCMNIDHINSNRLDNRIENLRLATDTENHRNISLQKRSSSGFTGVTWCQTAKKWRARCRQKFLGVFDCPVEASNVRNVYAKKEFGDFYKAPI